MAIRMTTPMSEIDALLRAESERIDKLIIQTLVTLGDMCVSEVRDRPQEASWFNQTGNLRSSTGYVIAANGSIVKYSDFGAVLQGSEGSKVGKALAEELAGKHVKGYVLIVVAGMHYAEYVEAKENKSVLASAELLARKELPFMLNKLESQVAK